MLKCLSRGKVNFEPTTSNGKKYLYPRYEHPHDKSGGKRIRLIHIIADAPPHQAVMFTNTHYDLRLASLSSGHQSRTYRSQRWADRKPSSWRENSMRRTIRLAWSISHLKALRPSSPRS
jgi:hypothetical protein